MPPPSSQVESGRRTRHRRCPPPRPAIVRPWPHQRRRCGMPAAIDSTLSLLLLSLLLSSSWALTYDVVAIATSLVAPPPLSLNAPSPLSLCRRLYHHANACLIAPLSCQQLVVTLSPLSPRQCLSCRAGDSLVAPPPLSLSRCLSCIASLAPVGCCFTNYLDVLLSLLSRRLVVALLRLSLRRSLSLRDLSHCAAVSLGHRPSQPQ